jgi:hypothetical protein
MKDEREDEKDYASHHPTKPQISWMFYVAVHMNFPCRNEFKCLSHKHERELKIGRKLGLALHLIMVGSTE